MNVILPTSTPAPLTFADLPVGAVFRFAQDAIEEDGVRAFVKRNSAHAVWLSDTPNGIPGHEFLCPVRADVIHYPDAVVHLGAGVHHG